MIMLNVVNGKTARDDVMLAVNCSLPSRKKAAQEAG
jgi:hypothetical protein